MAHGYTHFSPSFYSLQYFCWRIYMYLTVSSGSTTLDDLPEVQLPLTLRDLKWHSADCWLPAFLLHEYLSHPIGLVWVIHSPLFYDTTCHHLLSNRHSQCYWYYFCLFATGCWIEWKARVRTIEWRHQLSFLLVSLLPHLLHLLLTAGLCPSTSMANEC